MQAAIPPAENNIAETTGSFLFLHKVSTMTVTAAAKNAAVTGFVYEPWHLRYVGIRAATEITDKGITLEEYLGITSVYNY